MESQMYFFIADISGYTAFMLKNKTDFAHATLVITELMSTLVDQVKIPIEVFRLEGDAIFLIMQESKASKDIEDISKYLGDKILEFFEVFSTKLHELQHSTVCACGGCSNISQLNLKVIAHYGQGEIGTIGSFRELSGIDVIVAHRLLKNQIKEKRYLLQTEQAYKKLTLPEGAKVVKSEEVDKDLGTITVYVYYPAENKVSEKPPERTSWQKLCSHLKVAIAGFLLNSGLKKTGTFHNLPPKGK